MELRNDARNYCVIGDPAVPIRVSETPSGPVTVKEAITTMPEAKLEVPGERTPASFALQTLFGSNDEPESVLESTLRRMRTMLERVVDGLTTVGVTSHVSDDLTKGECKNGNIDDALWKLHMDSVDKAMLTRGEMIKMATNVASRPSRENADPSHLQRARPPGGQRRGSPCR